MHPRFHAIQVNPLQDVFSYVDVHGNNTGKHLQILDISVEMGKKDSNENSPKQNLHVVGEQYNTAVQPNKDKVTLVFYSYSTNYNTISVSYLYVSRQLLP